ncbi:hypothetical protein GE09DRAFT_1116241 [Coniochaeta sp. 2T2.1]|nr:hypothetical protein GE09DRAFT_1116241 [Coniochaeta sp. 2T2.1]
MLPISPVRAPESTEWRGIIFQSRRHIEAARLVLWRSIFLMIFRSGRTWQIFLRGASGGGLVDIARRWRSLEFLHIAGSIATVLFVAGKLSPRVMFRCVASVQTMFSGRYACRCSSTIVVFGFWWLMRSDGTPCVPDVTQVEPRRCCRATRHRFADSR